MRNNLTLTLVHVFNRPYNQNRYNSSREYDIKGAIYTLNFTVYPFFGSVLQNMKGDGNTHFTVLDLEFMSINLPLSSYMELVNDDQIMLHADWRMTKTSDILYDFTKRIIHEEFFKFVVLN